jgi:hypothetical protein
VKSGVVIGGDGGDAGRHGRPTLGAPSTLERDIAGLDDWPLADLVDEYGILWPGRGGDSGEAYVEVDGRAYKLNVLLKLVRIWQNDLIDRTDAFEPRTPQDWWERAQLLDPDTCSRAMAHMIYCEDKCTHSGKPPPSPYAK